MNPSHQTTQQKWIDKEDLQRRCQATHLSICHGAGIGDEFSWGRKHHLHYMLGDSKEGSVRNLFQSRNVGHIHTELTRCCLSVSCLTINFSSCNVPYILQLIIQLVVQTLPVLYWNSSLKSKNLCHKLTIFMYIMSKNNVAGFLKIELTALRADLPPLAGYAVNV